MDRSRPSDVATVDDTRPPPSSRSASGSLGPSMPKVSGSSTDHARTRSRVLAAMFGEEPAEAEVPARYERVRKLGSGAMGRVDLARDLQLDRLVALKTIAPDRAHDERARARIEQEARSLAQIDHPNVVSIYDVFESGGTLTLAMEFVEGQTLRRWLQTQPTFEERLDKVMAIAAGLQAAHDKGIVHRDVKPDNVIVTEDGNLKVVDFGLARSTGGVAPSRTELEQTFRDRSTSGSRDSVSLTRTGAMVGTPAYMAPEQFMGGTVDARTDQFALAVILFEALTGSRPFAGRNAQAIAGNIVAGKIDETLLPQVPTWLRPILRRALDAAPDKRFESVRAFGVAIDPHRRRRRRQMLFALPTATLALTGVVAWGASRPAASPPDPCAQAGEEVTPTWTPEMAQALQRRYASSAPDYGEPVAKTVQERLDLWTGAWREAKARSCQDTHHSKTQSMETFERSTRCYEQALLDFESIRGQLLKLEQPSGAKDLLAGLPPIEGCRDLDALAAAWTKPQDTSLDRSVKAARAGLSKVRAQQLAGKYAAALEGTEAVRKLVAEGAFRPLDAELELARGRALGGLGKVDEAREAFLKATHAAEASRHDERSVDAWRELVHLSAVDDVDAKRAAFYLQRADAALLRIDDPPDARRRLERLQAQVDIAAGEYEAAEKTLVPLFEALSAIEHPDRKTLDLRADIELDLGRIHFRRSAVQDAYDRFASAEVAFTQLYGPTHPVTLDARHNKGSMLVAQGKVDEGLEVLGQALEGRERTLGPQHEAVARTINSIASAHYGKGDYATALEFYERAVAIHRAAHEGGHVLVADTLANTARCLSKLGRHDEADARFRESADILEAKLGAEHPRLAEALGGWASAMVKAERFEQALELHKRVIDMRRKALGPTAPRTLIGEYNAAEVERGLNQRRSAKARIKRILAAENRWPLIRVHAHVLQGWILVDEGNYAAARASFEAAIAEEPAAGEDANLKQAVDKARKWMDEH